MITGNRKVGHASLRIRQTQAVPEHMRPRVRELCHLHTPAQHQGKGYATSLMHSVCREADKDGTVLLIEPKPYGEQQGLSQSYLVGWYQSAFGFAVIQAEPMLMARMPHVEPKVLKLKPLDQSIHFNQRSM